MTVEFYKPHNETLRKYMEGYYFISESSAPKPLHYWTFPNNFFIVSVNQHADIILEGSKLTVKPNPEAGILADYFACYSEPVEIYYAGPVKEITFYFKPLGIHQFIDNVKPLFSARTALHFNPFDDFEDKMKEVFLIEDKQKRIEVLEDYWLSKINCKDPLLPDSLFAGIESDITIEEVARRHGFSRQYLHKLFMENTGKSPTEYRKIHRFRNSISSQRASKNLTELTYNSAFYDQSHFIKNFRQFTNINPNAFFKKVDTNKENIWLFI